VRIDVGSWPVLPMFPTAAERSEIFPTGRRRTFNLGIGMILVFPNAIFRTPRRMLKKLRERWYQIGEVVRGDGVMYA